MILFGSKRDAPLNSIWSRSLTFEMIAKTDPEIARIISREFDRQRNRLEMIASENFTSAWPCWRSREAC